MIDCTRRFKLEKQVDECLSRIMLSEILMDDEIENLKLAHL